MCMITPLIKLVVAIVHFHLIGHLLLLRVKCPIREPGTKVKLVVPAVIMGRGLHLKQTKRRSPTELLAVY